MMGAYNTIAVQIQSARDNEDKDHDQRTRRPNTRLAAAVSAFPVPLSLAGNISGDMAYRMPYMIWFKFKPLETVDQR